MSTDNALVDARPPLLAIGLLAGAALGYEVLLIRLFSIIQWHHFAYMVISLALLGYGASGTALSFLQTRLLRYYPAALLANLALFALSVLPCFLLAQRISFNPQQMLWEGRQLLLLMAIYLLLSLPFFFAANAIALTLARFPANTGRVYAADLLGAGTGSLAVVLLLLALAPLPSLTLLAVAALACLPLAALELRLPGRGVLLAASGALLLVIGALGSSATLQLSPYKALSQALRVEGAAVVARRHGPLALLDVVENQVIPPRYAPGMSLNAVAGPPPQLSLFADGEQLGAITRAGDTDTDPGFLDQLTTALPYHLQAPRRVLVPAAGGGMAVLQALRLSAADIDALELNPQVAGLLLEDYAAFSGDLYRHPRVRLHIEETRAFLARQDSRYDLIQLAFQGPSAAAIHALSENYLYTTEAVQAYLDHLRPGGYLAVSQWLSLPPRATLKWFATAVDALRARGSAQPGAQLILIRGWQTSTLLVKNGVVEAAEIDRLLEFCRQRSFDVAWYPGMHADQANRYNRLDQAWFHQGARALLGAESSRYVDSYKFRLQPARDDRPYFQHFFKWSSLDEILALREQGGLPLLETGYPVIIATLVQAALASTLLILLPLVLLKPRPSSAGAGFPRWRVVAYFAAIGLAFLFVEIAFVQKFMRFLHHPVYTAAVVLAAFLVFAGLGSAWSRRFSVTGDERRGLRRAVGAIVLVGGAALWSLEPVFERLADASLPVRMLVTALLVAPLAFFMGLPFPLALGRLGRHAAGLLPLAWGVNGCASVLSAVLATLLAVHAGFTLVVLAGLLLYGLALAVFPPAAA